MLSHVMVGVRDVQRAERFYGPVLDALGLVLKFSDERWAAWKPQDVDRPLFIVGKPFDREPATAGNGQMVAFSAPSRAIVDRCYSLALELGGKDEGKPGLRADYHPNYYGAYFRDPDGNKLCVVCHRGE